VGADPELSVVADIPDSGDTERPQLGQLLVQSGHITAVQLDQALHEGSQTGERLGEIVIRRGWASEDDVAKVLADQWGLTYVDRASIWFDGNALTRLSREDAQRLEALPTRVEDGRVVVAVAEPNEHRLAELRRVIGDPTVIVVVPKSALEAGLRSDLLPSRGSSEPEHVEPPVEEPVVEDEKPQEDSAPADTGPELELVEPPAEVETEPEETPSPKKRKSIRAVFSKEQAMQATDLIESESAVENVIALAEQSRDIAEMLAAQAASIRDETAAVRAGAERLGELEERVQWLESELAQRDEALAEARGRLADVARLIGNGES
jgi:hypothetical protein